MDQVAPGVYAETRYESGNVGFVITSAGLVCIDVPMLPADVRDWKAQIESVTDKPVIALVQTDYDQIRVVGTSLFPDTSGTVPLIAHDNTWDRMKVYASDKMLSQVNEMIAEDKGNQTCPAANWEARMPDITFQERLVLYKGGREIDVIHTGGHSSAACLVHLPEENVVFSGDLVFSDQHPSMTYAETKQWLAALNQLRKMPVDVIVPGHGAICDKEATYRLSDYIRELRATVRKSFQGGRSKSETSSALIPEFLDAFPYKESKRDQVRARIKGGSDRIYDEYRALAKANAARTKNSTTGRVRQRTRSKTRSSSRPTEES
jgi:cyclase